MFDFQVSLQNNLHQHYGDVIVIMTAGKGDYDKYSEVVTFVRADYINHEQCNPIHDNDIKRALLL